MKLSLSSVGGFTGPAGAQTRSVDLAQVDGARGERLRTLAHAVDFAALPPSILKPKPQSWDFVHTLTVEDGERRQQIRFHSDAAPPPLRALAAELAAYPFD